MKMMNPVTMLLQAYYETLHDLLIAKRICIEETIGRTVADELKKLDAADFNAEKFDSYRQAAVAFFSERIEMYNPIGIQYTFDRIPEKLARQLELQLNWYDSTEEFEALRLAAAEIAEPDMTDSRLCQLAEELIRRAGAFPDKSIISAYQAAPALQKLPDYALARTIEEFINP